MREVELLAQLQIRQKLVLCLLHKLAFITTDEVPNELTKWLVDGLDLPVGTLEHLHLLRCRLERLLERLCQELVHVDVPHAIIDFEEICISRVNLGFLESAVDQMDDLRGVHAEWLQPKLHVLAFSRQEAALLYFVDFFQQGDAFHSALLRVVAQVPHAVIHL
mmetsp:Transcript_30106/g.39967  ORF Transcript_30106/g.39967 Transcript_30106/m.39967 type:complete len:163 (-) Transcript_30106:1844-2332(-)